MHLCQCHFLHKLHLSQKFIHWWNRKTIRWPIPKIPSRRREKWQGRIQTSLDTSISPIILSSIWQLAAFPNDVRKAAKFKNKNLSSKSALLILTVSTSAFHSTNLFLCSRHRIPTNNVAPFSAYKPTDNPQFLQLLWRRAIARNVSLLTLYGG